jgi:hypothetical protein
MTRRKAILSAALLVGVISAPLSAYIYSASQAKHTWPRALRHWLGLSRSTATEDDGEESLPDTPPPQGLGVITNRGRDSFKVIRKPSYLDVKQAAGLIAPTEQVLGMVMGSEARAYPTNQLNYHEMVVDRLGEVPILVSY